jgi:hypothetical protein
MMSVQEMLGSNQYDTSINCDAPLWVTSDILLKT